MRWSVWTGSAAGVAEHVQAFSTFGGWGAGDLIDAVLTPGGSAVVGSWQSDDAGLDVAVWTPEGDSWVRRSSTGTALQSTRSHGVFATAATAFGPGVIVAGWEIASDTGQTPVVWQSGPDGSGWNKTVLPDAGKAGTSTALRCATTTCAVAGRVDGNLALWRLADGRWSRVPGLPPIAVADSDRLAAPVDVDGSLDRDRGRPGPGEDRRNGGDHVDARRGGPRAEPVTAAVRVGPSIFVVAGDRLWQADAAAFR